MTIQITMDMLPEGEKNGAWECSEHYFFPHTQTLMEKKGGSRVAPRESLSRSVFAAIRPLQSPYMVH